MGKTTATRTGGRPGLLSEPEPQGQERPRTFPRRSQVAPEPRPLVHLGVGEVHDGPLVSFLLQRALQKRREEEELDEARRELRALLAVPAPRRSAEQVERNRACMVVTAAAHKRKRKKSRKKKTPRTSSLSLRCRARRRQRQLLDPGWVLLVVCRSSCVPFFR